MSLITCNLTDTLIPVKTGSTELTNAVSVSLEIEDDDNVFSKIDVLLPMPQNGKIIRSQAHKALAGRFRELLDMYFSDDEFWINGYTAVSSLSADETAQDET